MILEKLTIENLFCYYGPVEFDLAPPEGTPHGRNIMVIEGRNGLGKTSFLNSLKLLFGGVTDSLRMQALPRPDGKMDRKLAVPHHQFVWGDRSTLWSGILNTKAIAETRTPHRFRVRGLVRHGGTPVELTREWERIGRGAAAAYQGRLEILVGGKPLEEKEAVENLLHDLVPHDAIPFYYFDGELIQELAILDGPEIATAVRQLLDISSLDRLRDTAENLANIWVKESSDLSERERLAKLEGEQATLRRERENAALELTRLKRELTELRERRAGLLREQELLRGRGLEVDRATVQEQEKAAKKQLQDALTQLLDRELPLAPLRLPPALDTRVKKELDLVLHPPERPRAAETRVIRGLMRTLPGAVFDMGLEPHEPLTEEQKDFYRSKLGRQLESCLPAEPDQDSMPLLGGLSAVTATYVRELLDGVSGPMGTRQLAESIRAVRERRRELAVHQEELAALKGSSEHDRQRYRKRGAEITELSERIGALEREGGLIPGAQSRQRAASLRLTEVEKELLEVRAEITRREGLAHRAAMAGRVHKVMRALAERSRSNRRREVEENLNLHFQTLFSSHSQIARLEIDDQFRIQLLDGSGRVLGKGNVSAGMKQLVAVSFLWALKESARQEVPIAIDTPLARLDAEHQTQILNAYLPEAAHQVILLPTNSELTAERSMALRSNMYRHVRLVSVEGLTRVQHEWDWTSERVR